MILKIDELNISRQITEGEVVSIGRTGHGQNIELDSGEVSREHAAVKLEGGKIWVLDKKSTNGTLVNGQRVKSEAWHQLGTGDNLSIRGFNFSFVDPQARPRPEPNHQSSPPPKPPGGAPNTDLNARFTELVRLKLPIKIGRYTENSTNDIILPDLVPDDKIVGRYHAEITFNDGKYWIEDLDSKNGTYVNDERIPSRQPRPIDKKDTILIHLHYFNLAEGYKDLRQEVAIRAEGIGKTYANGFVGLNPMTVEIPYKQIVALMGPSGCGKSTLLKALNGDSPSSSGNVYIHGLSLRENYSLLKQKIGYVPQDDIIHKELLVEETLYLAAKLRLPDDTPVSDINQRITDALNSLNFDDDIRTVPVWKLSGGQRKRVCIAVELLSKPTILFLDEPTSPLDPETIEEFLLSLQKLAENGTTIVMVTHKPEDLNYADKVIFMAAKGYFVYYGSKDKETKKFDGLTKKFGVDNIIKVYTICGDKEKDKDKVKNKALQAAFVEKYYIKPNERIITRPPSKGISIDKKKSLLLQFYWLSKRYFKIKISDKQNLYLLLAQPFIIAGLVGFIFHSVNVQVMMLIAISAIWFGVSNSSKEIVSESAIYKRERMFNLNIHTYILSKWVVLSLISIVQVIIYIAIIHLRFYKSDVLGSFADNALLMFCVASSATLLGLFLSSYFSSTEKVLTVVPIALMPQIMLAGVVEHIGTLKVDILSYFTLGRWGTEGFLRIQHQEITMLVIKDMGKPPEKVSVLTEYFYNSSLIQSNEQITRLFEGIHSNIFVILFISIIMYILTYYSLKKKDTI